MKEVLLVCTIILGTGEAVGAQPLQIHPRNPSVFLYRAEPLVIVGSGEHYGAVLNLDFDYRKYLRTLGREGLNHTRLFTGPHKEKSGAFGIEHNTLGPPGDRYICPWIRSEEPGFVDGGNKFDLSRLNEDYFKRLREFMQVATEEDVIVEVTLFSSFYGALWELSPFHPSNNVNRMPELPYQKVQTAANGPYWKIQQAYVRRVVRELNEFDNFYFEIQNEPWADNGERAGKWNDFIQPELLKDAGQIWRTVIEPANQEALDWQRRISLLIREEEAKLEKKHLISQNYGNFLLSVPEVDPNIDILTFHYALPDVVGLNRHWKRPIGFNETGFSGSDEGPYRRQAWRFLMSGGSLFSHLDYSFSVGHEGGTDTSNVAPGGGSPELRRQLRFLREFLQDLDLADLEPEAPGFVTTRGALTWAMSNRRDQWVIYCEGHQPFSLEIVLPDGEFSLEWFHTASGQRLLAERRSVSGSPLKLTSESHYSEVVLRVEQAVRQ